MGAEPNRRVGKVTAVPVERLFDLVRRVVRNNTAKRRFLSGQLGRPAPGNAPSAEHGRMPRVGARTRMVRTFRPRDARSRAKPTPTRRRRTVGALIPTIRDEPGVPYSRHG